MKPYIFIGLLILALVAVIFFTQNIGSQCSSDSDCIPSACCHATQCAPKGAAPNCSDTLCTAECVPDTLDCGQASCICEKGLCKTEKK